MTAEDRTEPETAGDDLVEIKPAMIIGPKEKTSLYSCKLEAELEVPGGTHLPFVTLYDRRSAEYNSIKLSFEKIKLDQLTVFQHLVRMEIQYLAGCDIVWKSKSPKPPAKVHVRGGGTAAVFPSMSLLPPASSLENLASVAATAANDLVSEPAAAVAAAAAAAAPLSAPAAPSPDAGGGSGSAENIDFSDILNWDYRTGVFPLTDEALQQWLFAVDALKPKYFFAAAILLYMRHPRTPEEEAAFQRLDSAWQEWYTGEQITYEVLLKGPPTAPKRIAYSPDEINWCKTKLSFLEGQIKDAVARERLGLPLLKKVKAAQPNDARKLEAEALLSNTKVSARTPAESSSSRISNAQQTDKALTDNSANKDPKADVILTGRRAATSSGPDDEHAPAAKRRRRRADSRGSTDEIRRTDEGSQVADARTVLKDGKLVSTRDGRAAAEGNYLKTQFPNNYRNHKNDRKFCGRALTLGEENALFSA